MTRGIRLGPAAVGICAILASAAADPAMPPDPHGAFAARARSTRANDPAASLDLARWGLAHGAVGPARTILRRLAAGTPDGEAARLLGRVEVDGAWLDPAEGAWRRAGFERVDGTGWVTTSEADEAGRGLVPQERRWVASEVHDRARDASLRTWARDLEREYRVEFEVSREGPFDLAVRMRDPERVARLRRTLASFHAAAHPAFFAAPIRQPIQVVMFADGDEYCRVGRAPPTAPAYYVWELRRVVSSFGVDFGSLFHEVGHAYLEALRPVRPPPWFNEGVATFFEGTIVGESGAVTFGHVNDRIGMARWRLGSGQILPLRTFIAEDRLPTSAGWDHARAFSCYLHARGAFDDAISLWAHAEDPLDSAAFLERLLGAPTESIDADFRAWLLALPDGAGPIPQDP